MKLHDICSHIAASNILCGEIVDHTHIGRCKVIDATRKGDTWLLNVVYGGVKFVVSHIDVKRLK